MSVRIVASDISTKVLQLAKFGIYKDTDLSDIPPPLLKKYFQVGVGRADRLYRVKQPLRDMVTFQQINLSTPPYPVEGGLDMIFCRNVMIYFNHELRRVLVKHFEDLLRPQGYLFVGMSESLSGIQKTLVSLEPSVYRKA
jgi:chemotaxis protein methyltransferase CheR